MFSNNDPMIVDSKESDQSTPTQSFPNISSIPTAVLAKHVFQFFNRRELLGFKLLSKQFLQAATDKELIKQAEIPLCDYLNIIKEKSKFTPLSPLETPSDAIAPVAKSLQPKSIKLSDGSTMRIGGTFKEIYIKDRQGVETIFCDKSKFASLGSKMTLNGKPLPDGLQFFIDAPDGKTHAMRCNRNDLSQLMDIIQLDNKQGNIVTSSYHVFILIWDRKTGECLQLRKPNNTSFEDTLRLFALPGGQFAVYGMRDSMVDIWSETACLHETRVRSLVL